MKLKPKLLPYIALGTGLVGLAARIWLFATGLDGRGLLSVTHPANAITYILIAVAMALLILTVRPLKDTPPYSKLFRPSMPACIGSFVAAAGILYTTFSELSRSPDTIAAVACICGILAALSLVLTGFFRIKRLRPQYYFHAAVTAYLMLHILSQYQSWNIEPQLQNYFPQLLASVFLMITAYQRTALDAGFGRMRDFLFFNYGAAFFSILAIRGDCPVFYLCMAVWTATADCAADTRTPTAPMVLPEDVLHCIKTLEDNGFSAYAVGGCVRDHLLGLIPHDYDLCTNAKPEQICTLFAGYDLVRSGEKHGTVGVVINGKVYEITTYRTESNYSDNRHPDDVTFVDSIKEDLARRDFTVNAIAYSPAAGYVDPYGGQQDLRCNVLRAVGDPETRFHEDALRILRGVRFAARFHLEPEAQTLEAMLHCAPLMDGLAKERVLTELCGLLPFADVQQLLRFQPIITQVIPELVPAVGFRQNNPHHLYDVYTHIAHTVAAAPGDVAVRMAALLHDIGKPGTYTEGEDGNGHFYGHEKRSAEIAESVLHRLKAPNALREQVVLLIENHMTLFQPDKKLLRRWVRKHGLEAVGQMLALQKADVIATGTRTAQELTVYDTVARLLEEIRNEDSCLHIKDLAVGGDDLIGLGAQAGPQIGACLEHLLDLVVEETLPNEKAALLEAAKAFLK